MKLEHTLAAIALMAAVLASAQQVPPGQAAQHAADPAGTAPAPPQSSGEVRKIDLAQGKVTLRHGPLANLDMPAMTMVFTATDKKLLEGLKVGDKVRFVADKRDGVFVVSAIERE
jgi:Cu(I)/Ag(I) efflux system periplasmic protein CusF